MGYACPVCETPQRDGEHLANHLAFTAMLHGDAHERWLDDHAPDWSEQGAAELAPVAVDAAEEVPHETVFEDTTGGDDHAHDAQSTPAIDADALGGEALDGDAGRIIADAREMTRAMLEGEDGDDAADDDNKA